jgi:hypothetical protein
MSILLVEFSQSQSPAEHAPRAVFEVHPRPWRLGWQHGATIEIVDANGVMVAKTPGSRLTVHKETASRVVAAVNAFSPPNA